MKSPRQFKNKYKSCYRWFLTFISLFTLSGCAVVDKGFGVMPMALGLLRSPVTIKTDLGKNGPLTGYERCVLEEISDDALMYGKNPLMNAQLNEPVLLPDGTTKWVSASRSCHWPPSKEKEKKVGSMFSGLTQFDDIQDLKSPQNDTLLFVAISGGGVRAAVLAQATLVQLERKFNSFKKAIEINPEYELGMGGISPLLDRINVISTVSGGSLYAYRMARVKTLMENEEKYFKGIVKDIGEELNTGSVTAENYRLPIENLKSSPRYNHSAFSCPDPEPAVKALLKAEELYSSDPSHLLKESAEILNQYLGQEFGKARYNFFECIGTGQPGKSPTFADLGTYSASYYISPGNFFSAPLMMFFTNETYLSVLAGSLGFLVTKGGAKERESALLEHLRQLHDPTLFKLAYVTPTPRFFFNATALETGLPFVFTQRIMQLPAKNPLFNSTVRLDILLDERSREAESEKLFHLRRPLGKITTLEDLNSTPADMSLAFAAMASAAFPLGFEPLVLTKYGYDPVKQHVYESVDKLQVSDGGLYDNSGLSTLAELFGAIMKIRSLKPNEPEKRQLNLILLSINADADEYDVFFANKIPQQAGITDNIPLEIGLPIRSKALGIAPLNLIHYANKRRAEQLAINNISHILCSGADAGKSGSTQDNNADEKDTLGTTKNHHCNSRSFNFLYFPVNLSQLSSADRFRIPDPSNLYERLKKIPTDFRITDDDEVLINQAAELLVSSEQQNDEWEKNLKKMSNSRRESCERLRKTLNPNLKRLDEAFAFYTLCSAAAPTPKRLVSPIFTE
jgi:hypothetical protein